MKTDSGFEELEALARKIRFRVVEMSHKAETPHLGGALSVVDILVAAYWKALSVDPKNPSDPGRDRLIFSKGHAAMALYATLAHKGFFSMDLLDRYNRPDEPLSEQPGPGCAPGVEVATGSLGHGLPFGLGMAWAGKLQRRDYRVMAVISDGEANEGSVWEAALLAPAQKLDNLTVVVDYNKWQATGRSNEIMAMDPLKDKWRAFGWEALEVDGHDIRALVEAMSAPHPGRPLAVVAHTVKGKGVSFIQDDNNWHYRIPTAEEVQKAKAELKV
jgi:transketolase